MRLWLAIVGVLVMLGAALGAFYLLLPRYSPDAARERAVARLERGDHEEGLRRLYDYARRFPDRAATHPEVTIGRPLRLRIEIRQDGLLIDGPPVDTEPGASDITVSPEAEPADQASDVTVEQGPVWVGPETLVYAAAWPDGAAKLVRLQVVKREYEELLLPESAWPMTFQATAALLGSPESVYQLAPDLGGASEPHLLAVSPDRSWLIFRATADGESPYELWRVRPDGTDAQRLTPAETQVQAVAFSPDGTTLAYFDGPAVKLVGLADTTSRELKRYEAAAVLSPAAPAWSPDGTQLAWGVGSTNEWRLVTGPADDAEKLTERTRLHSLTRLEFLSDGWLLQSQQVLESERRLVTVRAEKDEFTSRVVLPDARDGTMSADGLMLAVRAGGRLRVYWRFQPFSALSEEHWPEADLPERRAGPRGPASPPPDAAAPTPPEPPRRPL